MTVKSGSSGLGGRGFNVPLSIRWCWNATSLLPDVCVVVVSLSFDQSQLVYSLSLYLTKCRRRTLS